MSPGELSTKPLHVLLIEDNPEDAFLIERYLRRHGFQPSIDRVETATEMRALLDADASPDVILADYNLPNFSGPAALALLKSSRLDIPFIMLSGAVTEETAVSSMRAGAADYISKQNLVRLVPAIERELTEAISRRREQAAQQALLASESRFDRLVAAMPLGLLISDADQRVVYANSAIESMLHYVPGSVRAGDCSLTTLFPDSSRIVSALQARPSDPQESLFESTCRLADGKSLDVLVAVTVLNPENPLEDRRLAVFIADISMRKKSEEMLRRSEKLAVAGRLAAVIAHEVNNPLEAITNCLYLIDHCELPPDARRFLETAQSELSRISQITVQTLRFHRSSTHARSTDLHELLDTVFAVLSSRFTKHNVVVEKHLGDIPRLVIHDGEVRHLITNIIANSLDAMPRGGRLIIRTRHAIDPESGQEGVRLTIADTGIGMNPETQNRLFEPFYSTKGITGTGLGLWICRGIVEKHGGSIRFQSREGSTHRSPGTVCTVFLPTEAPADAPKSSSFDLSMARLG
ncbi:MAG: response regulator [Acidobacteria bacterium]|nr:response regulator [Acidobacteriota bacterium]